MSGKRIQKYERIPYKIINRLNKITILFTFQIKGDFNMATSEMDYMNIGGGKVYWKTIATSSANQTYAQQLTELKTVWDGLTDEEKAKLRIHRSGAVYSLINQGAGIFNYITLDSSNIPTMVAYDISGTIYKSGPINGTITDRSNSNDGQDLSLEILTYERI